MILLYISILWLSITLFMAFMEDGATIEISTKAYCNVDREIAYNEYLSIENYYTSLSKGHHQYLIQDKNWENGGKIKIIESAGFQTVTHHYKIKKRIKNEIVHLISEESKITILGIIKNTNQSEAIFTFDINGNGSILGLIIKITFPSKLRQILASSVFTKLIWQHHANMEMKQLSRELESRHLASA
ncbi:MAG: hypothetical protein PHZ02_02510 [Desulfocapsaceae bacterium]|nr:hypothetical protein [Desulfocapsaceae bacterium]